MNKWIKMIYLYMLKHGSVIESSQNRSIVVIGINLFNHPKKQVYRVANKTPGVFGRGGSRFRYQVKAVPSPDLFICFDGASGNVFQITETEMSLIEDYNNLAKKVDLQL